MPELTTLVVDYGGVLTTSLDASFRAFVDRHDVDGAHLREVVMGAGAEGEPSTMQLIETGSISLDEFEAELARRLRTRSGGTLAAEGLVRAMFAGARPDETMLGAVRRAREHGLRTGLLSNSWGNRQQYDFPHFDTLFDAVVISGEVGLRKPDPDIYLLMARELGVAPEQCVFVDDIAVNVRAAAGVGMCGVHHVDSERTVAELAAVFGRSFG